MNTDILIAPSKSHESFGLVLVEAMSLGKPVVATNVGGMAEVIDDKKTGFICTSNCHMSLAEKIELLAVNQSLRTAMGKAGRQRYLDYFQGFKMAKEYRRLLEDS